MTIRNLDRLFRPSTVAVVGASPRAKSIGNLVMRNLVAGGFKGAIYPVNPHHSEVEGRPVVPSVEHLPLAPDLAVICTPPATVPDIVRGLGAHGTRAAIVLTAGLSAAGEQGGPSLQMQMLEAAKPNLFRILGPNCLGLLVPGIGLNASFAHVPANPGGLAFVSQSGALCTAMLDWAQSRHVGFSHVISLGNSADVDFGDAIDYLARNDETKAIVLYIESISDARKFMSASRAAARVKPVIAIKGGRALEGSRAARSHTGAMAGADDVYDAAFRRAGILRVQDIDELFDIVETLTHVRQIAGDRLVIMTNGGGPGVLVADSVALSGGRLATLSPETIAKLDAVLPGTWSRANPVDIIGDAPIERFQAAAEIVVNAPEADGVIFSYSPTAVTDGSEIARATAPIFASGRRPVFANWLGGSSMEAARRIFEQARIPTFDTPERAAHAFLNLVEYRRNQMALLETPPASTRHRQVDEGTALDKISQALSAGQEMLSEADSKAVLASYGIPVVKTEVVSSAKDAVAAATRLGFPVALKLLSPDITHKSDVGGVVLDLANQSKVRAAAKAIKERLRIAAPNARFGGFTVQEMARRPGSVEVIVGAATDPTFGPVLLFGHGGTAAEVIKDRIIGLPPLNGALARDMVARTKVARLLAGYRDKPPADLDALAQVLVDLSQMLIDLPEIAEVDVNPLLVDSHGVVALDARIRVKSASGAPRLSIRPYPRDLETTVTWDGRPITIRPIRPEDEPAHRRLLSGISPEDIRLRFFGYRSKFSHEDIARWTQIDYDREMALIATVHDPSGQARTLGVVRCICDPDNICAEFAILVDSSVKHRGLGRILMTRMIGYLRERGTAKMEGQVLADNEAMLGLVRSLGFKIETLDGEVRRATLTLAD